MVNYFNDIITKNEATLAIPKTSPHIKTRTSPWWNDECKATRRQKKEVLRMYQRTKSVVDKIELNRNRELARRTQKQACRQCWRHYVSSINSKTLINKIFKKVKKLKGNDSGYKTHVLLDNRNKIIDKTEVSNIFGNHFAINSNDNNYCRKFLPIKTAAHNVDLDFTTNLTCAEFNTALSQAKNSSPDEYGIGYQMLKHLTESAITLLVDIYNRIWVERNTPNK